jgi:hypothetical protein
MTLRRSLGLACPLLSLACLAAGLVLSGNASLLWFALPALGAWLTAWLVKRPFRGLAHLALLLTAGLSAAGLLSGAAPLLILAGAVLALAGWDVLLLCLTLQGEPAGGISLYEKRHFASLALALGAGLLFALAGRMLHIHLSFFWMLLLAALLLFCLERLWRLLGG